MDPQLREQRRVQLQHEFDAVIAPQKLRLSQRVPQLFQQFYEPSPTLPSANRQRQQQLEAAAASHPPLGVARPNKRPAGAGADVSKRPRNDFEAAVDGLFKELTNLINRKLWGKSQCTAFKQPVDPIKHGVPDYWGVIKHPMDLGTVKNKIAQRQYKTPLEARDDIRLVWRNCALYNQLGNPVRKFGDYLADVWEKAWAESRIEERYFQLLLQLDPKVCSPGEQSCGEQLLGGTAGSAAVVWAGSRSLVTALGGLGSV
jgi:hypothetical protein